MRISWLVGCVLIVGLGCTDESSEGNPFGSGAIDPNRIEGGGNTFLDPDLGGAKDGSLTDWESVEDGFNNAPDIEEPVNADANEDAASPDDVEEAGECEESSECDDGNECTENACVEGECATTMLEGTSCDDGSPCTELDVCGDGSCAGETVNCDDKNDCTTDSCENGCLHTPVESPECTLSVIITSPSRGEVLYNNPIVPVTGTVNSPVSSLTQVTLNGEDVGLNEAGEFTVELQSTVGVNMLLLEAANAAGQESRHALSYGYGDGLHTSGSATNVNKLVSGTGAWLDALVFDDNAADLDDISSLGYLILDNLDINSLIPHPLIAEGDGPGFAWCSWEVDIETTGFKKISYDLDDVSINPVNGGMKITGKLTNFEAWIEAVDDSWFCPDGLGWVRAASADLEANATVAISNTGEVLISVSSVDVVISGVVVDIEEGFASLFNWLIGWFQEDLENLIEEELESFIPDELLPVIQSALNEIAHVDESFVLPALPGGVDLPLTLSIQAAGAQFTSEGAELALSAGLGVESTLSIESLGSIARGFCGAGGAGLNPVVGPILEGSGTVDTGVEWGAPTCCEETEDVSGCGAAACESCVCDFDPYCCTTQWDTICVTDAKGITCDSICQCPEEESGPSRFADESCAGNCNNQSGSCWCDALCVQNGDCCSDACELCGYCQPTEVEGTGDLSLFSFDKEAQIEVRIHEDVLNHILHGAWQGEYMNLDLDSIVFEPLISPLGATDMNMTVLPLMPPMVTTCTDDGELEVHLGAILCDAEFTFNGVPASFKLYASIKTEIEFKVVESDGPQSEIGVQLKELEEYQVDILDTQGLGSLGPALIDAVLNEALVQLLVADVLNNLIATYPIPTLDLNALISAVPAGSLMTGDFDSVGWKSGHFTASGAVYSTD